MANALSKSIAKIKGDATSDERKALKFAIETLVKLSNPIVPHLTETCWAHLGHDSLLVDEAWPEADKAYLTDDTVTLPIQVNGKKRGELTIAKDATKAQIEQAALSEEPIARMLDGNAPKKVIVVPGRIVNVVI